MHRSSITLISASVFTLGALAAAALAPGAGAAGADAAVDVYPNRTPTADDPNGTLELVNWTAGESYEWNLTTSTNYTIVELRIHDGFNVTRGKQLVPLVGGNHFVEIHSHPSTVDRPATVYNLTGGGDASGAAWTYDLGVEGPATTNLTLHRDVDPPGYKLGEPRNVTHCCFDVKTTTSEVALATLIVEPPPGSDEPLRDFPTPRPAPLQRFPVQGLDPNTTYRYHVEFTDWSGNTARTGNHTVTTAPAPDPPEPEVTPTSPLPNATVEPEGVVVSATWSSPESPVVPGGIRLFVDKVPVEPDSFQVEEDALTYRVPKPLPTRNVSVSVEVPNAAGGTGIARWTFTVEEAQERDRRSPALGPAAAAVVLAGAALVRRRRR